MKYQHLALIDSANVVQGLTCIEADAKVEDFDFGELTALLIKEGDCAVGDIYKNKTFVKPEPIPEAITVDALKLKLALSKMGLYKAVLAACAANEELAIEFAENLTFSSDSVKIAALCAALGQPPSAVTTLFEIAASL